MKYLLLLAVLIPHTCAADGWLELFDGKTTNGWTPRTEVVKFEAKDGELHLLSKKNCWVTSDLKLSDFEAELEVFLPPEPGFNSGLAFRCQGKTGKPKGYQIEIDQGKPGGVYGIGLGGWLYPGAGQNREFAAKVDGLLKPNDWNHFRVRAQGQRIQTWLNGKPVSDLRHAAQLDGYFGIQHHGKGGTVKFRNIRARALAEDTSVTAMPNILWITAEDMSPTLGCYGDAYATTPNLDRFAAEATRYDNAFAASPVCSPSRSSLITGMYNTSTGTHQMRSGFPLPSGVRGFPSFLREAGYFTSNNVKTDYNSSDSDRLIEESWDESSPTAHWRSDARKPNQPFFAVFNLMTSHQSRSMVWPHKEFEKHVQSKLSPGEIHPPREAPIPPYYPDTPAVRKGIARYYDCVTVMDQEVGAILGDLEEDGLADDTIVFFYSDHGSGMPRHKRLLHDSGMKIAMLVRFPDAGGHLRPTEPGAATDRLVSFVDFAPTVLQLAGIRIPDYMQGAPFLASDQAPREVIYGTRDRVDEVFDCARSVRDKRWLYIRNYQPHLGWGQASVFSDLGEIRASIRKSAKSPAQLHFTGASRSPEELYDCSADTNNVHNLMDREQSVETKSALARLRKALISTRSEIRDLGAIPESQMRDWVQKEGAPMRDIALGETNHAPDLDAAWAAADLVGSTDLETLVAGLSSASPAVRYWAVLGLRSRSPIPPAELSDHLDDTAPCVRIEAASWLAEQDQHRDTALQRLASELGNEDWSVALQACRAIELLGETASSLTPIMRDLYERTRHTKGDDNLFLAFSSGAFLEALGEKTERWDFSPGAGNFMPPKKTAE
ncbi:MAG: sulfatase-like hydrolase/transferase [Verrucomicrobiales bacterium]